MIKLMDFTTDSEIVIQKTVSDNIIHLHLDQHGRKSKTTVAGLSQRFTQEQLAEMVKKLKKSICQCSGNLGVADDGNQVIVLFGDQRLKVVK